MPPALSSLSLPQRLAAGLIGLWPVINLVSRQSAPVVAGLLAALLVWALLDQGGRGALASSLGGLVRAPEFWLLAAALILVWVETRTSPVPKRAVQAAGQMSFGLLTGLALAVGARALPAHAASLASITAAIVGIPALMAMIRFWDPLHSLFGIRDLITHTNRTAVLLALLLPIAFCWCRRRFGTLAALALGAGMVFAVFYSYSESAKLAVAVAIAVAALHRIFGITVIWIAGILSALIVVAAPLIGLHIFDLIPGWVFRHTQQSTFGIRGDIWREFSALALQKPLFGWGVEASSAPLAGIGAGFSEAQRKVLELGHTHNAPLQIWYELGLAGALVTVGIILAATRRIARMAAGEAQAVAAALAAAAFAIAAVSHGAWQVWWYCLVAMVAVLAPGIRRQGE